jgi:hypothetical protein
MEAITDKMFSALPDFMASSNGRKSDSQRPRALHTAKSFSRLEPASPKRSTRSQRASTIQNGVIQEVVMSDKSNPLGENERLGRQQNAFENESDDEGNEDADEESTGKLPADFDELPIELVSLTDR